MIFHLIYIKLISTSCSQLTPNKDIIHFFLHLFYTNLNFEDNDDNVQLSTLVKGVDIKLTPKSLGRIFHIPYHGLTLSKIEMTNGEVYSCIYLPGQGPPMTKPSYNLFCD